MKRPVPLKVELIHIAGPMKGKIQEFSGPEITFGRHPSCDVIFPKDLTIVSRKHAKIVREGNRFKLIDQSTNGTLVNGKPVKEYLLRNGDVITFAQGGPKLSFLLTKASQQTVPTAEDKIDISEQETLHGDTPELFQGQSASQAPLHGAGPEPASLEPIIGDRKLPGSRPDNIGQPVPGLPSQKIDMPVVIQFGPVIKSFKTLPVTMGTDPSSDFVIDDQACPDVKVEISFHNGQYMLRNLSGRSEVTVNGRLLGDMDALSPNDVITFGQNGPRIEFIGQGRFAEMLQPESAGSQGPFNASGPAGDRHEGHSGKNRSFFKKIFGS